MSKFNSDHLEDRFFYRLVMVLYFFCLAIFFIISIFILDLTLPMPAINVEKSYISCDGGKVYSLQTIGINLASYETNLDTDNDNKTKKWCFLKSLKPVTDPKIIAELNKSQSEKPVVLDIISTNKNYSLELEYQRDWSSFIDTFFLCLFCFLIFYIVINIIKETLIYLAFGKKFSWGWATLSLAKKEFEVLQKRFRKDDEEK